jgi:hypothetical protein
VGRHTELRELDRCWRDPSCVFLQIAADGGVGKSTLIWQWLERFRRVGYRDVVQALDWSFYSQEKGDYETDSQGFLRAASEHFGLATEIGESEQHPDKVGRTIGQAFLREGGLVVLDGLEPLQYPPHIAS